MINFDYYTNVNKTEYNPKWLYIPDNPYKILVIGGTGLGKTNVLLNLISNQIYIIYSYSKKVGLKHYHDPKVFMEYSNDMQDVYKNTEEYSLGKKRKVLIVFDDVIADMVNNKKLNSIVTELFIRGRKLNISIFFITHSYFKVPKEVRLNSTH